MVSQQALVLPRQRACDDGRLIKVVTVRTRHLRQLCRVQSCHGQILVGGLCSLACMLGVKIKPVTWQP